MRRRWAHGTLRIKDHVSGLAVGQSGFGTPHHLPRLAVVFREAHVPRVASPPARARPQRAGRLRIDDHREAIARVGHSLKTAAERLPAVVAHQQADVEIAVVAAIRTHRVAEDVVHARDLQPRARKPAVGKRAAITRLPRSAGIRTDEHVSTGAEGQAIRIGRRKRQAFHARAPWGDPAIVHVGLCSLAHGDQRPVFAPIGRLVQPGRHPGRVAHVDHVGIARVDGQFGQRRGLWRGVGSLPHSLRKAWGH